MATSGRNNKAPEYGALEDALVAEGQSVFLGFNKDSKESIKHYNHLFLLNF